MREQPTFFDFAAEVGLTKHIGRLEDTPAVDGVVKPAPPTAAQIRERRIAKRSV